MLVFVETVDGDVDGDKKPLKPTIHSNRCHSIAIVLCTKNDVSFLVSPFQGVVSAAMAATDVRGLDLVEVAVTDFYKLNKLMHQLRPSKELSQL